MCLCLFLCLCPSHAAASPLACACDCTSARAGGYVRPHAHTPTPAMHGQERADEVKAAEAAAKAGIDAAASLIEREAEVGSLSFNLKHAWPTGDEHAESEPEPDLTC